MTSYERRMYLWLRRELAAEFGLGPVRTGRRRALRSDDERRVYAEIRATPRKRRGKAYLRLARELGAGVSTLQGLVHRMTEANQGSTPRTFHEKPQNAHIGATR